MLGHLSFTTATQALIYTPVIVTVPDTAGVTLLVADNVGFKEGDTDGVNDIVSVRDGVMLLLGVRVCVTVVVGVNDGVTANIYRRSRLPQGVAIIGTGYRVRHSVAMYSQLLVFCDQSMREKAWRSRKRGA